MGVIVENFRKQIRISFCGCGSNSFSPLRQFQSKTSSWPIFFRIQCTKRRMYPGNSNGGLYDDHPVNFGRANFAKNLDLKTSFFPSSLCLSRNNSRFNIDWFIRTTCASLAKAGTKVARAKKVEGQRKGVNDNKHETESLHG